LRTQTAKVSSIVVDISEAGQLVGPSWTKDIAPSIVKHAPAAFEKYGIQADVFTTTDEAVLRPSPPSRASYVVSVKAKDRYFNSRVGTTYGFDVTFLSPQGVKLWHGSAAFQGTPLRDYDATGQRFVERLAERLHAAGMFGGTGAEPPKPFQLSDKGQTALRELQARRNPKAFVVEDGGHWFWAYGRGDGTPRERTMKACTEAGYTSCRPLVLDDEVFD
jgi:hypothetical protein